MGASAVLFGTGVMLMSALLSFWSSAVFAGRPTVGFSAALFLFGLGSIVGPALMGAFASGFGLDAAFLLTATLALVTALVRPAKETRPAKSAAGQTP